MFFFVFFNSREHTLAHSPVELAPLSLHLLDLWLQAVQLCVNAVLGPLHADQLLLQVLVSIPVHATRPLQQPEILIQSAGQGGK